MLMEIFRQMAQRGAIDEQKKEWAPPPAVSGGNDEDESDYGDSDSD
jgi:hypothetical protein